MKQAQANTATGLVAVQTDFGMTYVNPQQAHMLAMLYGAKILGRQTATTESAPCECSNVKRTGRRVIVRK